MSPYQAFLGVCDVLTAHCYQLLVWDPTSFGPLLHTPSPKLQRALLTFVCTHVFVGPDCDNQSSGETSARLHGSFFPLSLSLCKHVLLVVTALGCLSLLVQNIQAGFSDIITSLGTVFVQCGTYTRVTRTLEMCSSLLLFKVYVYRDKYVAYARHHSIYSLS